MACRASLPTVDTFDYTSGVITMANPSNTSVTIDGKRFNAMSVHLGIGTHHDHTGMPMMGSAQATIDISVDVHDTGNMPFVMLQQLFEMANCVTRDKIKDVKIEYWQDESQTDAICTYSRKAITAGYPAFPKNKGLPDRATVYRRV